MDDRKITVKILRGCSGSGKSTLRRQWLLRQHYAIISRDALRTALFAQYGKKYDKRQEDIITDISLQLLQQYIAKEMDVIIDNTNLKSKDVRPYLEVIDEYNKFNNNINIEFVDLTDISLKVLKKRNSERTNKVPEAVLEKQFKSAKSGQTFYKDIYRREKALDNNIDNEFAVIFDLDGTLAIKSSQRGWYDVSGYIHDTLNDYVFENYRLHKKAGDKIIICTARDEECKEETLEWLKMHNIEWDEIYFRNNGDTRKDSTVKKEMWEEILKRYYVHCLYDDRLDVIKKARRIGLNVFAVNHLYY